MLAILIQDCDSCPEDTKIEKKKMFVKWIIETWWLERLPELAYFGSNKQVKYEYVPGCLLIKSSSFMKRNWVRKIEKFRSPECIFHSSGRIMNINYVPCCSSCTNFRGIHVIYSMCCLLPFSVRCVWKRHI